MIVRRLMLNPFAGGADRVIDFGRGLNVVLGPNEAGKSTISSALRSVLFARGPMTVNRFKHEVQPFLPVGRGDTARVALEFTGAGKLYRMERMWAAPKTVTSRLQFDDGSELADEEKIQQKIEEALGFSQGTYDYVMCVSQAQLSRTIDQLRGDADGSAGGFADALRRSLYASDGVAVDQLKAQAEKQVSDYFGRWDRAASRPEKGRGLEERWEKGAGFVVNAWYDYQEAEKAFREADVYEKAIDEFVAKERTHRERRDGFQRTVEDFTPLVADVRRRSEIAAALRECTRDLEELKAVLEQWPLAEAQLATTTDTISSLLARHEALKAELQAAKERVRQDALRSRFSHAEALHSRMKEEEARLANLPRITETQLAAVNAEHAALQSLEIRIAARKFAVRFAAKASIDLTVKGEPVHLAPGQEYSAVVPGRLSLAHKEWNLEVWSSEENAETLEQQHAETSKRLEKLLHDVGAKSFDEATALWRSVAEQGARVNESRAALAADLRKESYEDLLRQIQELPEARPGRDESAINDEINEVTGDGKVKRVVQKSLQDQCDAWVRKFGRREDALSLFGSRKAEEERLRESLRQCRPMPQGFQDPEAFLTAFEAAQNGLRDAERALNDTEKARLEYEKHAPPQSREELQEERDTRKREFDRTLRHGNAYGRIQEELRRILQVLDKDIFEPYHRRVRELLGVLTNHRHESLLMNGPLPERLGSSDKQLALMQLSVGTLDVLALAVRMAMAEAHLRPDDGFVVLDDPLVNLDPVRQAAAAHCLRELSLRHQVIVFTCHPTHADLLGGDRVDLEKSPATAIGAA
ncbi:MAG TPA: AAA family ATPase [Bacteroidota bacterium]|nr:AAA family ATPase [Bacteroidota bacterium]